MTLTYDPSHHLPSAFLREGRQPVVASRNERALLRLIWDQPGIARSALTKPLDLTQQSLHRLVEALRGRGMIRFTDASVGGSPRLELDRSWCLTIGVSVNVGSLGVALLGFGEVLTKFEIEHSGNDLGRDLDHISNAVQAMMADQPDGHKRCLGAGLAIAGYSLGDGMFNAPLPLKHWSLVDLAPLLAQRLKLPIWADNVANTSALAEAIFGHGRGVANFSYVAHNFGYGGALIANGQLARGDFGNAGELSGLFDAEESTRRPALHLLLEHLRAAGRPDMTLAEMLRDISPDWPGVMAWIDAVAPAHNRAMNALSAVIDPELIILGGELPTPLGDMLIERTAFNARERFGRRRRTPRLAVANVTKSPGAIGAGLLPLFETVL